MAKKTQLKRRSRERRRQHIRKHLSGSPERPRLVVFRSNKEIYGQIINDLAGETLVATSSTKPELADQMKDAKSKVERAKVVGKHIAELAKEHNIEKVVFDRAGYLYHGRVKAFADGAREGGLNF